MHTVNLAISEASTKPAAQAAAGAVSRAALLLIWAYTAAILGAEWVGAYHNPLLAMVLHGAILFGLLAQAVTERAEAARRLLLALTLLPLLRLVSMTAITSLVPTVYLYVLVAIPLANAIFLITRLHALTWATLGLSRVVRQSELWVALAGLPLSLAGYWLLQPTPLINRWDWPAFLVASLILIIFAAAVEELLFRGVLQHAATAVFGSNALLYGSVLYAISYSSWQSLEYTGAALLLGLGFGWWVRRSGSLWGVIAAHSLINIGMLLIWPLVF